MGLSMKHGLLTAAMANMLSRDLNNQPLDVLYDHGQKELGLNDRVGKLASWFDSKYKLESRLSFIDIAVVLRSSQQALVLIEIEETTDKPKVVLGDVMAILMGKGMKFQGKRDLLVGRWTTLIVLAYNQAGAHRRRVAFLEDQVNHLKSKLATSNASIGRIVIDTFRNELDLEAKLRLYVNKALTRAQDRL
jgi:hypothetical protein